MGRIWQDENKYQRWLDVEQGWPGPCGSPRPHGRGCGGHLMEFGARIARLRPAGSREYRWGRPVLLLRNRL